jgi:hypothetical protein
MSAHDEPLCLTAVGTTSSGKSTLLNLLSGRLLLPFEAQESPRVSVEIHHTPGRRDVLVRSPLGPDRPVFARTDEEARGAIERAVREALAAGAAGAVRVDAPVALGPGGSGWWQRLAAWVTGRPAAPALPEGRPLVLRDLPGYLSRGDAESLEVIARGIAGATVLVVFNAEETDAGKEEELLRFVLGELRRQGQPRRRLFFVLNRIDAFARDGHRPHDLARRAERLERRVGELVREEYELDEAPRPALHRLASLPALSAAALAGRGRHLSAGDRRYLLGLAGRFAALLPDEATEALPRAAARYCRRHLRRYCDGMAAASGWGEFRAALCRHAREAAAPAAEPRRLAAAR